MPKLKNIMYFALGLLLMPTWTMAQDVVPCQAPADSTPIVTELPPIVPSSPPRISLSEVLPDPAGRDQESEFIELRNLEDNDIDLSGWSIKDAGGKIFTIHAVRIPSHGQWSFLYAESKIVLNNEGESLTLSDPSGATVDEISFNAKGRAGEAFARTDPGAWQWTIRSTPGNPNVIELPPTASVAAPEEPDVVNVPIAMPPASEPVKALTQQNNTIIVIAAFLANPVGLDNGEWVDIRNDSDATARLEGWRLDDDDGGSTPFEFSASDEIASRATMRVMKDRTHISLNNDRDAVRLLAPDGSVRQAVAYQNPPEGKIRLVIGGEWKWVDVMPAVQDAAPQPVSAAPAPESAPVMDTPAPDGTTEITGTVTVAPGRIGKATFLLLDDAGRGVVVRLYGMARPALETGDHVTIRGKLHDSDMQPWISTTKANIATDTRGKMPAYESKDIAELTEDDAAAPVSLHGILTGRGAHWLRVADADGQTEIKAIFPNSASLGSIAVNSTIEIKGVVHKTSTALELIVSSKKHLAVSTPASEGKKEKASEKVVARVPPAEQAPRQPLVLGSVEKNDRRPLLIVIGGAAATAVLAVALYWKKKTPVA